MTKTYFKFVGQAWHHVNLERCGRAAAIESSRSFALVLFRFVKLLKGITISFCKLRAKLLKGIRIPFFKRGSNTSLFYYQQLRQGVWVSVRP